MDKGLGRSILMGDSIIGNSELVKLRVSSQYSISYGLGVSIGSQVKAVVRGKIVSRELGVKRESWCSLLSSYKGVKFSREDRELAEYLGKALSEDLGDLFTWEELGNQFLKRVHRDSSEVRLWLVEELSSLGKSWKGKSFGGIQRNSFLGFLHVSIRNQRTKFEEFTRLREGEFSPPSSSVCSEELEDFISRVRWDLSTSNKKNALEVFELFLSGESRKDFPKLLGKSPQNLTVTLKQLRSVMDEWWPSSWRGVRGRGIQFLNWEKFI